MTERCEAPPLYREAPLPPQMRFRIRDNAAALTLAFNGEQYRAVVGRVSRGRVSAERMAAMLEELAKEIRRRNP